MGSLDKAKATQRKQKTNNMRPGRSLNHNSTAGLWEEPGVTVYIHDTTVVETKQHRVIKTKYNRGPNKLTVAVYITRRFIAVWL
jgi:hypothetical protein